MGADDLEKKQTHLKPQDAAAVDPSKLTALTPEVVSVFYAESNHGGATIFTFSDCVSFYLSDTQIDVLVLNSYVYIL